MHAACQPEPDEDVADLPLADTQGGGGGGGGEKQGRRHKRLELHRVGGILCGCVCEDTMYISRILLVES